MSRQRLVAEINHALLMASREPVVLAWLLVTALAVPIAAACASGG